MYSSDKRPTRVPSFPQTRKARLPGRKTQSVWPMSHSPNYHPASTFLRAMMPYQKKVFDMIPFHPLSPVTSSVLAADDPVELGEQHYWASRAGVSTYCFSETRLPRAGMNVKEWLVEHFSDYTFYSNFRFIVHGVVAGVTQNPVRGDFYVSKKGADYSFYGDRADVLAVQEWMKTQGFKEEGPEIAWIYGDNPNNLETYNLPLEVLPAIEGMFPWLSTTLEDYTARFLEARENILILLGPPGTGKSSFIKQLIGASKKSAMVSYNTGLLFSDGFFANFMTSSHHDLLIIEDSDDTLRPREDGNQVMHKFLNVADGLVSLKNKKIVFTTNLPSVRDIDHALIRPGRCYEVITTRAMTQAEATLVRANAGLPAADLTGQREWTLAEVMNLRDTRSAFAPTPLGFLG